VFGTTLQRMIFGQLVRVFALALCGLTGLFLAGGVIQEASQRGLTPSQIVVVAPLLVPNTLPYTVPATVLFACCVVYGRMAHDHEITALRAAGVHLGRLLAPAVVLAVLAAGGLTALQSEVIPRTRQRLAERVLDDVDELVLGQLKRNGCIRLPKEPMAIFVREVRGRQLIEPVFKRRGENGTYQVVARAREAKLWTDLANGRVCIFMPNCAVAGDGADGTLRDQTFEVAFPVSSFRDTQVRPMNMTGQQIRAKWAELDAGRAHRRAQLATLAEQTAGLPQLPEDLVRLKRDHEFHLKEHDRVERHMRTELNMRPALAVGGLCFALIAFPVGVWLHRSDYLSTFVSCFLPVVLAYYPMLLAGSNLSRDGRLPPAVAVWTADAAAATAGVVMLRKLFRQ
jgi:lipopolysaccharide export system permease protein